MTQLTKEMQAALLADGEKLKALTGIDHGPFFVPECHQCLHCLEWIADGEESDGCRDPSCPELFAR